MGYDATTEALFETERREMCIEAMYLTPLEL